MGSAKLVVLGPVAALAFAAPALAQVPDTTPPTVVEVRAYDGLGGNVVLPGTVDFAIDTIAVTFSEEIDPATVSADTVRLIRSGGDGTFGDGNEVEIVPVSVTLDGTGMVATVDLTGAAFVDDDYQLSISGHAARWALSFDGVDDYVPVGTTAMPANNAPQSICLWYYVDTHTAGRECMVALVGASSSSVQVGFIDGELMVWQWFIGKLNRAPLPTDGMWHHLAYTYDGTTHRLHVDGVEVDARTTTPDTLAPSSVEFGRTKGWGEHYKGLLDEVSIWNAPLTRDQILARMHATLAGNEAGLTGYFAFEEGEGQSVFDASAFGNHGHLGNSATADSCDPTWVASTAPVVGGIADLSGNILDGDGDGSPGPDYECTFTVDAAPPTVESTLPGDTDTGVEVTTDVSVTFSERMNETDTALAFSISPLVAGTAVCTGSVLTFTPDADLASETFYTVTIDPGARDLAGKSIASEYVFSFTTEDAAPPTVDSITADGTDLPDAIVTSEPASIVVTFSEQMDSATVTTDTVRLVASGRDGSFDDGNEADVSPVTVTLDGTGMVATVDLTGATMADDVYQVTVSAGDRPTAGLVARWKLDETSGTTAHDWSGNGYDGTNNGATVNQSGVVGTAYTFDGNDVITTTDAPFDFTDEFSITVWIYRTGESASNWAGIVDKIDRWASGYAIARHPEDRTRFAFYTSASGWGEVSFNADATETWHHLAAVFENGKATAYRNGLYQNHLDRTGERINVNDNPLRIGEEDGSSDGFVGKIDDVRIYDRALSAAEIAALADPTVVTDLSANLLDGDGDGTSGPDYVCTFTLDRTPPTVLSTSPIDGATITSVDEGITVTFSEPMDETTLLAAFSRSPEIAGTPVVEGNVLTLTPLGGLASGTTYTVTVSTVAEDPAGHALESPCVFGFTLEDNDVPDIVSALPGDGATDVPLSTSVTVTFSEIMDAAATAGAFSIEPAIAGSPVVSGDTLTLAPAGGFESDTQYIVTVSTAATDLVGLALAAEHVFGFTTTDLTAPADVTELAAHASAIEIELVWRNPFDLDFAGVVVLRSVDEAPTGSPADGATYAVGNIIGNAVVLHVGTAATGIPGSKSGWSELGVEEGREYHYALFTFDERLSYSAGATASTVPGEGGGGKDGPCGAGPAPAPSMLAILGVLALARRPKRRIHAGEPS